MSNPPVSTPPAGNPSVSSSSMSKTSASSRPEKSRLSLRALATYSAPGYAMALLIPPFPAIMAAFYAQYTAATAAGIATILLVSRLFDAFTDIPMGYISDATRTRIGGRKPWLIVGSIVGMAAFWVFFQPAEDAGNLYFLAGFLLYYLAFTMIDIPLRSWSGELSQDYNERSTIASWLTFTLLFGGMIFMLLPVALNHFGLHESGELDRSMIALIGQIGMVILPLTILIAVFGAPTGHRVQGKRPALISFVRSVRNNRPFWIYMGAFAASSVGFGAMYAVLLLAWGTYYDFGELIPILLVAVVAAQLLSVPIWNLIVKRVNKHLCWGYAWFAHAAIAPVIFLFPASPDAFWPMMALGCFMAFLQAPHMMFPMAILNDIVDYDTLKTGEERAGNYFSLKAFLTKGASAVGSAIGFYVIAIVGYDPKADENTPLAELGLLIDLVVIPAIFFLIAAFLLLRFPITSTRHAIIRRRLDQRAARVVAKD